MKELKRCTACTLSEGRKKVVPGQGPTPCLSMFITKSPGPAEDIKGIPLIGKSGREFNDVLSRNKILRENVYVTNICKCHPTKPKKNRDPKPEEIETCTSLWLWDEITKVDPQVIGAVGRFSARWFLGDVDMERVHGIPFEWQGRTVVPIYRPAAGLRNPAMMEKFHRDIEAFAAVLRKERSNRHLSDQYPQPIYEVLNEPAYIEAYLTGAKIVAVDTEWARGKPWCLSLSVKPGEAIVVMANNKLGLNVVAKSLANINLLTLIHNSLYDLPVLSKMDIFPAKVADTMIMAYLLQSEPQGLKALSFRHCGMVMSDYSDMVSSATFKNALEYLQRVIEYEWPRLEYLVWEKGLPRLKKPQALEAKTKKIIDDTFLKGADPYKRWNNIPQEEKECAEILFGTIIEGDLSDIPQEEAVFYAARDADATIRVYPHLWEQIQTMELEQTFWTDMSAVPMVADMHEAGILVEKGYYEELSNYFQKRMDEISTSIRSQVPKNFNIGSPKQVAELLYEDLKIKKIKGDSTEDKILATIKSEHPIIQPIRDWRGYSKLRSTYSGKIPGFADASGRVHATFKITRTSTGRLSASSPNLMAQPVRSDEGRKIRKGFIAASGCSLVSSDYSQLEMRILAHVSQDPELIQAFLKNLDIHSLTGARMWGIPLEDVDDKKHRYPAKRINYGIIYGIGAQGLYDQFMSEGIDLWSVRDCEDMIQAWLDVYKGAKKYISNTLAHARRYGFVRTMFGRIRYIPGIRSQSRWIKAEAERMAINAPIQGAAADIMKKAMGDLVPIYREQRKRGVTFNPLVQIHDDLIIEVSTTALGVVVPLITGTLTNAVELSIPTPVDPKVGQRWGEMVSWKEYKEKVK